MDRLAARGRPHPARRGGIPGRATLTLDYADPTMPVVGDHRDPRPVRAHRCHGGVVASSRGSPMLDAITDGDRARLRPRRVARGVHGLYQLLGCPWMNPPASDDAAGRARRCSCRWSRLGLRVPDTVMTSDRDAARAFIDRHGIGPPRLQDLHRDQPGVAGDAVLVSDVRRCWTSLRLAPVIFQELHPGGGRRARDGRRWPSVRDGDRLPRDSYDVDFRVSLGQARTTATTLPPDVEEAAAHHGGRLGWSTAPSICGSRRRRVRVPGGEPRREFLFGEHGSGPPITDAVAGWLAAPGAS